MISPDHSKNSGVVDGLGSQSSETDGPLMKTKEDGATHVFNCFPPKAISFN